MKTLSLVMSVCMIFVFSSCKNSLPKSEKLFIKTTTAIADALDSVKATKVVSEINTDYFEVGLSAQTTGGYLAQKDIVEPEIHKPFKAVFFVVSQKDGTNIKFMTSTEFLNFMSAHGYDLVNQIPNEYGGDYTFKRKKL